MKSKAFQGLERRSYIEPVGEGLWVGIAPANLLYTKYMFLKLTLGFVALGAVTTGGYFVAEEIGVRNLKGAFEGSLGSGDYLAALGAAVGLKEKVGEDPDIDKKIMDAARMLVAEDALRKAKAAREEKRYGDAAAFLRSSDAVSDPAFKYYVEAIELFKEMEALAAAEAHKTSAKIGTLEQRAESERAKREAAEKNTAKLQGTIKEKEQAIGAAAAQIQNAAAALAESKKEAEAKQAALNAAKERERKLAEEAEKESIRKFVSELKAYKDMTAKGRSNLDNAIVEINGKRDVPALVYVSQGKVLIEEARTRVTELRSRAPSGYGGRADDLLTALAELLEAAKQIQRSSIYIEDQGSSEFTDSMGKAKTALSNASSFLSNVSNFITTNGN